MNEAAPKWFKVGIALGVSKPDLDKIDEDCKGGYDEKFQKMIITWQEIDDECSWRKLMDAFRKLKCGNIAKSIEKEAWKEIKIYNEEMIKDDEERRKYNCRRLKDREQKRDPIRTKVYQRKFEQEQRYSELVKKIRDIVQPASSSSDQKFDMDMIDKHIRENSNLTTTELNDMAKLAIKIGETCKERSEGLKEWGETLIDDIKYAREVQGKLNSEKQRLEEEKDTLQGKKKDINEEMKRLKETVSRKADDFRNSLKGLRRKMYKIDKKLANVNKKLAACIEKLNLANSGYMAISDELNECIKELKACQEEFLKCKDIIDACYEKDDWDLFCLDSDCPRLNIWRGLNEACKEISKGLSETTEQIRKVKETLNFKAHPYS